MICGRSSRSRGAAVFSSARPQLLEAPFPQSAETRGSVGGLGYGLFPQLPQPLLLLRLCYILPSSDYLEGPMEITLNRSEFLSELSPMQGIVERRTTIPVLSHILLRAEEDRLSLAATDLDVSLDILGRGRGQVAGRRGRSSEEVHRDHPGSGGPGDHAPTLEDEKRLSIVAQAFSLQDQRPFSGGLPHPAGGSSRGGSGGPLPSGQGDDLEGPFRGFDRGVALSAQRRPVQGEGRRPRDGGHRRPSAGSGRELD